MPDGVTTKPRASKLKAYSPELIRPRKPKMLIFGASGVGKTLWSLSFPQIVIFDVEGGATQPEYRERLRDTGGLYLGPEDGAASFDEVMQQVKALATERHDRKTLVIDSVTKLFANEIAREAERLQDANKKNEFGADKRPAVGYMRQLVAWLTRLDMNVILICGEVAEWGVDAKGERGQIGATFDAWPRLEYELDLAIQVTKQGPSRYGRVRKSRIASFRQGDNFPWTYDAFVELYGRDVIENGIVETVDVATPEQLAEIVRLLEIVKLDEGTVDKWLAAANVSAWDEMPSSRVEKAIAHLKGRIAA